MTKKIKRAACALLVAAAFVACSDQNPVDPTADLSLGAQFGKANTGKVRLVWLTPVQSDISMTQQCQVYRECVFSMDRGVEVVIPDEALSQATEITVTILQGSDVNFRFAPHGLQFREAIDVSVPTSEIEKLNAHGKVVAQYWETDPNEVLEELDAWIMGRRVRFAPVHFSGYALAM